MFASTAGGRKKKDKHSDSLTAGVKIEKTILSHLARRAGKADREEKEKEEKVERGKE